MCISFNAMIQWFKPYWKCVHTWYAPLRCLEHQLEWMKYTSMSWDAIENRAWCKHKCCNRCFLEQLLKMCHWTKYLRPGCYDLGLYSVGRRRLISIGIPIINLRRSSDRLTIRRRLLIEYRPWIQSAFFSTEFIGCDHMITHTPNVDRWYIDYYWQSDVALSANVNCSAARNTSNIYQAKHVVKPAHSHANKMVIYMSAIRYKEMSSSNI